ncbi:hypothetical protein [Kribbella speibonae]|uniref:Uncharacterized protein n=1 Tax=Kribbella speibonae TaxID=1572660 RepID=A0A4R0J9H8_9ACTN|nr:hypothetical protein [Kribbella speibonae]TCC42390.1 hypothetical protein E0H92_12465 [Kribbella speibonae]
MDVVEPTRVVQYDARSCLGIRVVTPFRGMLGKRNELLDELIAFVAENGIDDAGPFFSGCT